MTVGSVLKARRALDLSFFEPPKTGTGRVQLWILLCCRAWLNACLLLQDRTGHKCSLATAHHLCLWIVHTVLPSILHFLGTHVWDRAPKFEKMYITLNTSTHKDKKCIFSYPAWQKFWGEGISTTSSNPPSVLDHAQSAGALTTKLPLLAQHRILQKFVKPWEIIKKMNFDGSSCCCVWIDFCLEDCWGETNNYCKVGWPTSTLWLHPWIGLALEVVEVLSSSGPFCWVW